MNLLCSYSCPCNPVYAPLLFTPIYLWAAFACGKRVPRRVFIGLLFTTTMRVLQALLTLAVAYLLPQCMALVTDPLLPIIDVASWTLINNAPGIMFNEPVTTSTISINLFYINPLNNPSFVPGTYLFLFLYVLTSAF